MNGSRSSTFPQWSYEPIIVLGLSDENYRLFNFILLKTLHFLIQLERLFVTILAIDLL